MSVFVEEKLFEEFENDEDSNDEESEEEEEISSILNEYKEENAKLKRENILTLQYFCYFFMFYNNFCKLVVVLLQKYNPISCF